MEIIGTYWQAHRPHVAQKKCSPKLTRLKEELFDKYISWGVGARKNIILQIYHQEESCASSKRNESFPRQDGG